MSGKSAPKPAEPSVTEGAQTEGGQKPRYRMGISLNVLNHLGLNLYSNVPAVLSEAVANSWDADASLVEITVAEDRSPISIRDDGRGMDLDDVNDRFLRVGYERRRDPTDPGAKVTQVYKRPVMGRKGIGKLSLFSIANVIEVYTCKNGKMEAFRMSAEEIRKQILEELRSDPDRSPQYNPTPLSSAPEKLERGTLIVIRELKAGMRGGDALRKRVARRFSVLGEQFDFQVRVDGDPVTIEDRGYWNKVQFIWYFGKRGKQCAELCQHATERFKRDGVIELDGKSYNVEGWIGTAELPRALKDGNDNLNAIMLMVRNKLAEEDLLQKFSEGGVYTKYVIGEIHADFLDLDDKPDIATSSRQQIIETDPRFGVVLRFIGRELHNIESQWTELRAKEGVKKAIEDFPPVKRWYDSLTSDKQKRAQSLFGKINQITSDSVLDRRELVKHAILAFETLSLQGNLDALDKMDPTDFNAVSTIIGRLDGIDATLYYEIVKERLEVIDALRKNVDENARERLIQRHLFDHLWLLSPSWERATDTPKLEQRVATEFKAIKAGVPETEAKGRIDIRYKRTTGTHVIVELKRPSVSVTTDELASQVNKYRRALEKILDSEGKRDEPVEVVCILGKFPSDWDSTEERRKGERSLKERDIRVVLYDTLIEDAYEQYRKYFERHEQNNLVFDVVKELDQLPLAGF